MKNSGIVEQLSFDEMVNVNGGSLLGEFAYILGVTAKSFVYFCQKAGEFQSSLPPNLKK